MLNEVICFSDFSDIKNDAMVLAGDLVFNYVPNEYHDMHYVYCIHRDLPKCYKKLEQKTSRQATIRFSNDSCLLAVQFQILNVMDDLLYVTAYYRSLDKEKYLPYDKALLYMLAKCVETKTQSSLKEITIFAGNYH